jgi:hypothetical protein
MESSSTRNTFGREACRPLRGLETGAVTVPPPEGGGWGSFAAYGGMDWRHTEALSAHARVNFAYLAMNFFEPT